MDALALFKASSPDDLEATRLLLKTIELRGYARDRDLLRAFDVLASEASV